MAEPHRDFIIFLIIWCVCFSFIFFFFIETFIQQRLRRTHTHEKHLYDEYSILFHFIHSPVPGFQSFRKLAHANMLAPLDSLLLSSFTFPLKIVCIHIYMTLNLFHESNGFSQSTIYILFAEQQHVHTDVRHSFQIKIHFPFCMRFFFVCCKIV